MLSIMDIIKRCEQKVDTGRVLSHPMLIYVRIVAANVYYAAYRSPICSTTMRREWAHYPSCVFITSLENMTSISIAYNDRSSPSPRRVLTVAVPRGKMYLRSLLQHDIILIVLDMDKVLYHMYMGVIHHNIQKISSV
jgi:hypothetical protein